MQGPLPKRIRGGQPVPWSARAKRTAAQMRQKVAQMRHLRAAGAHARLGAQAERDESSEGDRACVVRPARRRWIARFRSNSGPRLVTGRPLFGTPTIRQKLLPAKARNMARSALISHAVCATTIARLKAPFVINSCALTSSVSSKGVRVSVALPVAIAFIR
jgi:hypothetical protein